MAFTLTNFTHTPIVKSPLNSLISNILPGVQQGIKTRYMPRMMEADIFHKQISPLAMLASSPYFSSLQPAQQNQIAEYITQMMARNGIGGGSPMGEGNVAGGGGMNPGQSNMGQPPAMNDNQQNYENDESLTPRGPAEHFTGGMKQSPYTPGVAHRGANGQTVYAPTADTVQQGLRVLREEKGFNKTFESFKDAASTLAKAGPLKETASVIGSNVEKTLSGIPGVESFGKQISEKLGGSKVANARATMEEAKVKMTPFLEAIGINKADRDSMFKIHPGETDKNISDRMKLNYDFIQKKINNFRKILHSGQTVNKHASNQSSNGFREENKPGTVARNASHYEQYDIPEGYIGLYDKKGKAYYFPPEKVEKALKEGFRYE